MEPIRQAVAVAAREETDLAEVRRAARGVCERIGLQDETTSRAEIVVTELAANALRHGGGGLVYLSSTPGGGALQVIAADRGAGIADLPRARGDGFTTGTTPGLGLGAVERLAGDLDVYSEWGKGAVISALVSGELSSRDPSSRDPSFRDLNSRDRTSRDETSPDSRVAVLSTALDDDPMNGDTWAVLRAGGRDVFLLVDGLGHGLYASEAATMAREIVTRTLAAEPTLPLEQLMTRMHGPMHATRGAAVVLVSVAGSTLSCCGVGNISATLHLPDGTDKALISSNGTVGHQMRRVQEVGAESRAGSLLSMHSDGLSTRWRLGNYPGLRTRRPATIAGVLYRDAVRGRDDATVLVAHLEYAEAAHTAEFPGGDHGR